MTKDIELFDKCVFQYSIKKLKDATPEQICEFYVRAILNGNGDYLMGVIEKYHLPSDMLKMHSKIISLMEQQCQ